MSTNGLSHDKYHLLYQSSSEEEELFRQPISSSSNRCVGLSEKSVPETEKALLQAPTNGIKKTTRPSFAVVANDKPYNKDIISIATKNGIMEMPKGSIPLSIVRSRSSSKFTESSMLADKNVAISTSILDQMEAEQQDDSFVVKELHSSDTLQGVALLYHTTVSSLKFYTSLVVPLSSLPIHDFSE